MSFGRWEFLQALDARDSMWSKLIKKESSIGEKGCITMKVK